MAKVAVLPPILKQRSSVWISWPSHLTVWPLKLITVVRDRYPLSLKLGWWHIVKKLAQETTADVQVSCKVDLYKILVKKFSYTGFLHRIEHSCIPCRHVTRTERTDWSAVFVVKVSCARTCITCIKILYKKLVQETCASFLTVCRQH